MKLFKELKKELDEANFKADAKKLQLKAVKVKNVDIYYHSEKSGSDKVRVYVKPKGVKEPEELGVYKDIKTAEKSATQFVKLMGEDIKEGMNFFSKVIEESKKEAEIEEGKFVPTPKDLDKLSSAIKLNSIQKDILFSFMNTGKITQKYSGRAAEEIEEARPTRKQLQNYYDKQAGTLQQKKNKTEKEFKIKNLRVLAGNVMRSKNEKIEEEVGDTSVEEGVEAYVTAINNAMKKSKYAKQYKEKKEELRARAATKYWRIETFEFGEASSIHAFVDKETGDIFKPAGWGTPAKGPRGNITDSSYIASVVKTRNPQHGGHLYVRG